MTATSMHRKQYPGNDPGRRTVGWVAVVALHAFIGWALVTGTARKALEVIKKPMEAAVIQEVIIPPPPPPPPPPPKQIEKAPPKVEAPPPPFVPPPEVTPPPSTAPAIVSVPTPPVAPPVIAPPPPPAAPAPPAPPARVDASVACPTMVPPQMPRQALRDGTGGVVKATAVVKGGRIVEVNVVSGPRVFHSAVREAMLQYRCNSPGDTAIIVDQEFVFRIE
jgi:protein TonB